MLARSYFLSACAIYFTFFILAIKKPSVVSPGISSSMPAHSAPPARKVESSKSAFSERKAETIFLFSAGLSVQVE